MSAMGRLEREPGSAYHRPQGGMDLYHWVMARDQEFFFAIGADGRIC